MDQYSTALEWVTDEEHLGRMKLRMLMVDMAMAIQQQWEAVLSHLRVQRVSVQEVEASTDQTTIVRFHSWHSADMQNTKIRTHLQTRTSQPTTRTDMVNPNRSLLGHTVIPKPTIAKTPMLLRTPISSNLKIPTHRTRRMAHRRPTLITRPKYLLLPASTPMMLMAATIKV